MIPLLDAMPPKMPKTPGMVRGKPVKVEARGRKVTTDRGFRISKAQRFYLSLQANGRRKEHRFHAGPAPRRRPHGHMYPDITTPQPASHGLLRCTNFIAVR